MSCPTGLKAYRSSEEAKGAMLRQQQTSSKPLELNHCGKCYDWHVVRVLAPIRERPS